MRKITASILIIVLAIFDYLMISIVNGFDEPHEAKYYVNFIAFASWILIFYGVSKVVISLSDEPAGTYIGLAALAFGIYGGLVLITYENVIMMIFVAAAIIIIGIVESCISTEKNREYLNSIPLKENSTADNSETNSDGKQKKLKSLPSEAHICTVCGSAVRPGKAHCPKCGADYAEEFDAYVNEYTKMHSKKCPECGTLVAADKDICPKCSHSFSR